MLVTACISARVQQLCHAVEMMIGARHTSIATIEIVGFPQAFCLAIVLQIICHCAHRTGEKDGEPGFARDSLPTLFLPGGERPHVDPTFRVVVAEAICWVLVPTAGARVLPTPQHKSCSSIPRQCVSDAFVTTRLDWTWSLGLWSSSGAWECMRMRTQPRYV